MKKRILSFGILNHFLLACVPLRPNVSEQQTITTAKNDQGEWEMRAEAKWFERQQHKGAKQQRVLVLDMIHVGPAKYYQTVLKTIELFRLQNPGAIALREGIWCSADVFYISSYKDFDPDKLMGLRLKIKDTSDPWGKIPATEIKNLPGVGLAKCVNKELPQFEVYCEKIKKKGLECQPDFGAPHADADINASTLAPVSQVLLNGLINCNDEEDCPHSRFGKWLGLAEPQKGEAFRIRRQAEPNVLRNVSAQLAVEATHLIDEHLDTAREKILFNTFEQNVQQNGTNAFIIAWGADHSPSIYEFLQKLGFAEQLSYSFTFAKCRVLKGVENGLYADHCEGYGEPEGLPSPVKVFR